MTVTTLKAHYMANEEAEEGREAVFWLQSRRLEREMTGLK